MNDENLIERDFSDMDSEQLLLIGGKQGRAYERLANGDIGPVIPGVKIVYVREDGHVVKSATTNSAGFYRLKLDTGRYWVVASHPDYALYSSSPGFSVVTGVGYQTHNFFLKKLNQLTVLLLRHAEADYDADPNDPVLTPAGEVRAQALVHVAAKAGVNAVYATEYRRTQLTVEPLADSLGLVVQQYAANDTQGIVQQVLANHSDEVVVIAGHSNTVPLIAAEFGASFPPAVLNDFDNLIVLVYDTGNVDYVHLQYGATSP